MTATLATHQKQHTEQTKAWAVSLYNSGATCYEVEEKTGIRATYVRTLARRFSEKKEIVKVDTVAPIPETVALETVTTQQDKMAVKQHETNWRASIFVCVSFAIIMGHSGLIWYDMAKLWAVPGAIGGGIVFAFIFSGLILMSDKSEQLIDVKENMMWAVGALESLAIVVHQATFYRAASEAYIAGLGVEYTWGLAAIICLCSIGATIFYKKVIS